MIETRERPESLLIKLLLWSMSRMEKKTMMKHSRDCLVDFLAMACRSVLLQDLTWLVRWLGSLGTMTHDGSQHISSISQALDKADDEGV